MRRPHILALTLAAVAAAVAGPPLVADDPHPRVAPLTTGQTARLFVATTTPPAPGAAARGEAAAGGVATAFAAPGRDAFSRAAETLSTAGLAAFAAGERRFRQIWVAAPAGVDGAPDGLGPLYNARSCQRCHINGGRGHPPDGKGPTSMVLHVSVPADTHPLRASIPGWIPTAPEPTYGAQLQDRAVAGVAAEYAPAIDWREIPVALSDGQTALLRQPVWRVGALGYGPLRPDAMISPRVAPPMIGLGLLEAIPAAAILRRADPDDDDGDGISGRASVAWSTVNRRPMLGRFGWKAGAPTLLEQVANAFAIDMGIANPLHPAGWGDCTAAQASCRVAPHGGGSASPGLEINAEGLEQTTFYSRNLAAPAQRDVNDATVLRGEAQFHRAGCAACHQPSHVSRRLGDRPAQSEELIWPYTDLLLHDMGEGLADHRPEGVATGREWRTPPLWGIGLTRTVSGDAGFLHDGRARSLLEAVLWHGGEAQAARDAVVAMPAADRAALIRFLESL